MIKILQSIVARKGTEVEAIKTALGEGVSDIAKLDAPVESGAMVQFEQMPRDAFKADSFEVVALKSDNSILAIQGELSEPVSEDGFITKMFKKPVKKSQIMMESDLEVLPTEALKSQLSSVLYDEVYSLNDAIRGIIGQEEGSGSEKVAMVRAVLSNFTAALETAMVTLKCDKLDPPAEEDKEAKKSDPDPATVPDENLAPKPDPDPAPDGDPAPDEPAAEKSEEGSEPPAVDIAAIVKETVEKTAEALKPFLADQIKTVDAKLSTVQEEVQKMQKTPATVVSDHADDGTVTKKSQKDASVFSGLFTRQ